MADGIDRFAEVARLLSIVIFVVAFFARDLVVLARHWMGVQGTSVAG